MRIMLQGEGVSAQRAVTWHRYPRIEQPLAQLLGCTAPAALRRALELLELRRSGRSAGVELPLREARLPQLL